MKKCVIILILFLSLNIGVSAQFAEVIEAPALEASNSMKSMIQTGMMGSQKKMQSMQKQMDNIMKNAAWLKQMKSVKQVIELMGETICMSADLQVNLDLYGSFDVCGNSFDYESGLMKLQSAVDFLNTLISKGQKLTTGERLNGFKSSIDLFTEAMIGLYDLNQQLLKAGERSDALKGNLNTSAALWAINPRK